jgi:hypothetical protein
MATRELVPRRRSLVLGARVVRPPCRRVRRISIEGCSSDGVTNKSVEEAMRATGTKANVQRILGRVAGATASTKSEVEEMPEDKRQALRLGLQRHEVGQVLRNVSRELAQREQQIADRRTICSQRSGPRRRGAGRPGGRTAARRAAGCRSGQDPGDSEGSGPPPGAPGRGLTSQKFSRRNSPELQPVVTQGAAA